MDIVVVILQPKQRDYGYATTPDYWATGLNECYHATAYGVIATCAVRPPFYLLSSVNFAGGDGTSSSPLRIN